LIFHNFYPPIVLCGICFARFPSAVLPLPGFAAAVRGGKRIISPMAAKHNKKSGKMEKSKKSVTALFRYGHDGKRFVDV
jgi:hypothetical protein